MLCLHHLPLAVNEGNMLSMLITQAKCLRRQPSYATAVAKSEAVSSVGLPANATAKPSVAALAARCSVHWLALRHPPMCHRDLGGQRGTGSVWERMRWRTWQC